MPRIYRTTNQNRYGFTLIELLVVIAIIALLAAILFPVFASAREKARQSTCTSNLKQLGLAFTQYEQDFDEVVPSGQPGNYCPMQWAWQIYPYVKSGGTFICPDDPTPSYGQHQPVSYIYNANVAWWTNAYAGPAILANLSKIQSPARTVLLYEGQMYYTTPYGGGDLRTDLATASGGDGGMAANGYDHSDWMNDPPAAVATGQMSGGGGTNASYLNGTGTTPRHVTGSNFLCLDGHVKFLAASLVSCGRSDGFVTGQFAVNAGLDAQTYSNSEGTQYSGPGSHVLTFSTN